MQEATGKDCDFHKSLELYRTIAAMALLCCGTVYFLGGILCFGLIKRCELLDLICLWAFFSRFVWKSMQKLTALPEYGINSDDCWLWAI